MVDPVRFAWEMLNKTPFPEVLGVPNGNRGHGISTYNSSTWNYFNENWKLSTV